MVHCLAASFPGILQWRVAIANGGYVQFLEVIEGTSVPGKQANDKCCACGLAEVVGREHYVLTYYTAL